MVTVEFIAYRGYEFALMRTPLGWNIAVQPTSPSLPTRPSSLPLISNVDRQAALEDGQRAVDELLAPFLEEPPSVRRLTPRAAVERSSDYLPGCERQPSD